jgi:hypothetical protein
MEEQQETGLRVMTFRNPNLSEQTICCHFIFHEKRLGLFKESLSESEPGYLETMDV